MRPTHFLFCVFLIDLTNGQTLFGLVCKPNMRYLFDNKSCICDKQGKWISADCNTQHSQFRRLNTQPKCIPGQVTWQACNQCICQEDGHIICSNLNCDDHFDHDYTDMRRQSSSIGFWCEPYRSYYVECSICMCPASGKTSEAICAADSNCSNAKNQMEDKAQHFDFPSNVCIPKVMYLFPCLHCLCSDRGYFVLEKCIDTCQRPKRQDIKQRCIPRTFYRKDCNICHCPDDSFPDSKYCSNATCNGKSRYSYLHHITAKKVNCSPYSFTQSRCIYCECSTRGVMNIHSCLELDCMTADGANYATLKTVCSPGEMVPLCMECYCLKNGTTNTKYCTRTCSDENRLNILNAVLRDSLVDLSLVDVTKNAFMNKNSCKPRSAFRQQNLFCFCPERGIINLSLCMQIPQDVVTKFVTVTVASTRLTTLRDINTICKPNTYVDFDCNSCFCSKSGRIDPNWCTYDDCAAKQRIEDSNAAITKFDTDGVCTPGSIYKKGCNFCICPLDGTSSTEICTKNECTNENINVQSKLTCVPMSYYDVDCNTCRCPPDGRKNVAKCTKLICEKSYLRSDSCEPADLFYEDCKLCVCPPSGVKSERICFDMMCHGLEGDWRRKFQFSDNIEYGLSADAERRIEVCFPGEEYTDGCKVCVCTDVGLRAYAKCTPMNCDENDANLNETSTSPDQTTHNRLDRVRREDSLRNHYSSSDEESESEEEKCAKIKKLTKPPPHKSCTPGTMYIVRCRECICPYYGNLYDFCRKAEMTAYCEQPFFGTYWEVPGRRVGENASTHLNSPLLHNRTQLRTETKYTCDSPGNFVDKCHICHCVDGILVLEECFKSSAPECENKNATFLRAKQPFEINIIRAYLSNSTIENADTNDKTKK